MTTKEKQLKFWTELLKRCGNQVTGTPAPTQYMDLAVKCIMPLKIRLDFYSRKADIDEKGYLTFCLMLPDRKLDKLLSSIEDYNVEQKVSRFFLISNRNAEYAIGTNPEKWEKAIDWFLKNISNTIVYFSNNPR